jgi:Icc-related predicted phosphoesterase
MKILFSSDLHGYWPAIQDYSEELAKPEYDIGILSGDILDDGIPDAEMKDIFQDSDLDPDDFLPELPGADESYLDYLQKQLTLRKDPKGLFIRSLQMKEKRVRERLSFAAKKIYIVPGNHDQTSWIPDHGIVNLHGSRIEHGGFNLVGYRWTELDRSEREHIEDIRKLKDLVDDRTIFVSHRPAYGFLDEGTSERKTRAHIGSREIS